MQLPMNGVCPRSIELEIKDGLITKLQVVGGCDGNLKGLQTLLVGADAAATVERLSGITCGRKKTSCPDQIAQAILTYLQLEAQQRQAAQA